MALAKWCKTKKTNKADPIAKKENEKLQSSHNKHKYWWFSFTLEI